MNDKNGISNNIRIRCIIIFFYTFLCSLNQYVKLFGIPVFMFLILIYACIRLFCNGFMIRKSLGIISPSYKWHFNFFILWIFVGFLFAIFVNNEAGWRNFFYLILNIIGYYIVFSDSYYYQHIRNWCYRGIGMGVIANILVAFWELRYGRHIMVLTDAYFRRFENRPLGFYVNTNDLAIVLMFMLSAILIGYIFNSKTTKNTIFYCGILILGIIVIFSSRSIISIAAAGCIVFLPFFFYQARKQRKTRYLFFLILFFIGFLVLIVKREQLLNILLSVDESSFTGRQEIWSNTWNLFESTAFIGIGPGQNTVIGFGSVHNLILEIMTEYGLIIGILFIVFVLSILKGIFQLNRSFINCIGVVFCFLFIPLSICSSSMTKLFPIWPCIGIILSFLFKDNEREVIR